MKLLSLFLLSVSVLSLHCCTGYPVSEDDIQTENELSFDTWLGEFNHTTSNDSSQLGMHGIFKKIVDKVKDKAKEFNKIKDKIKNCKDILKFITYSVAEEVAEDILTENGPAIEYYPNLSYETGFNNSVPLDMHGIFKKIVNKVKNKVKDGFNKVKDKIQNCKDLLKIFKSTDTGEISKDILSENENSIEYWFSNSNETAFNDSLPLDGFFKKIVDKVKEKIKDYNRIKDKIKDCKDILKFITFSVAEEVTEDILTENVATVEYWSSISNETAFNGSYSDQMHGFFKKVVDKVKNKLKEGFNKVKDKVLNCKDLLKVFKSADKQKFSKDILSKNENSIEYRFSNSNETEFNDSLPLNGFFKKVVDKVKDKIKDYNKIKDKIKDCKDILKFITFSVAEEVAEDILTENVAAVEYWSNISNETAFNGSFPDQMHGFFKKVVDKVKNKLKDGFNKVKDKVLNCKDLLKVFKSTDKGEKSEDILSENGNSIEYWFSIISNETTFNESVPLEGFGKKVVNKVKDGIKTGKDGLNKVKDKLKDNFNKVKDKFKDWKDKVGSKGGSGGSSGGGSGYYRDKYNRDYDRDRYDRDYYRKNKKSSGGSGSGSLDPAAVWFLGAFGILSFVIIVVSVIYYKTKY